MENRILFDESKGQEAKIPVMPIIVSMEGYVAEASSIKGAAAIIIGNHYFDSPDENLDWNLRVEAARKECMKALRYGKEAVVFDKRTGIIKDNYAAADNDEDYKIDKENPEQVRVENDCVFLLSLVRLGAIRLLEREDSFLLRPNVDRKEYSGGSYIDIYQQYNIDELIESFS